MYVPTSEAIQKNIKLHAFNSYFYHIILIYSTLHLESGPFCFP